MFIRGKLVFLFVLTVAMALVPRALAHPAVSAVASVKIDQGGHLTLTLTHDALAFALGDTPTAIGDEPMWAILHGPDEDLAGAFADGRDRLTRQLFIKAGGQPLVFQLTDAPTLDKARAWQKEFPDQRFPMKLDFVATADLPSAAAAITFTFPRDLGEVILSVTRPGLEPLILPVNPGQSSPAIDISMATGAPPQAPPESSAAVAWRFTKLGFDHILGPTDGKWWHPQGLDHCLFVLGLFLLIPRVKPVLFQISSFTLAHTLTLTLTSLHIIGLSSRIVEPTIAATIAFIAIENLAVKRVSRWRIAVAFVFGLVHGMGVATSFNEAGFPPGQLVTSLAAFTVGVEGGHIAMLLGAFATLSWFRNKPWYRKRVAIPLSILIAIIALVWVVQRAWPGPH